MPVPFGEEEDGQTVYENETPTRMTNAKTVFFKYSADKLSPTDNRRLSK